MEPIDSPPDIGLVVTPMGCLCGHLDLKTGATHCAQYLSRFLPADVLHVWQVEPELQSERVLFLSHDKVAGSDGAAELLQIKPNTLRSKMKKLGIPYGWKR